MVDLTPKTIKTIFEERIRQLTRETPTSREDAFDIQFSGGWLR